MFNAGAVLLLTASFAAWVMAIRSHLLAATNQSLIESVASGRFRQDLDYRLNVITIDILPLRERAEDILHLARYFLGQGKIETKRLSRAAAQVLLAHHWPGNARELDTIRRAIEQTGGNRTRTDELLGITRRGLIYKLKRLGLG